MNHRHMQPSIQTTLDSIVIQFFEMVPIRRIQWHGENVTSQDLDVETQKYMISRTVSSELCAKYPPSFNYQKAFLKKLLSTLETFGVEICDEIYEAYTELLQHSDKDDDSLCYKTYTLDAVSKVTIQESVNMISFGTTGLSTWQAAQHLAEWGLQNKHLLQDRHILELGCGLGLTGLAISKVCNVKSYTFTDCNTQVLNLLAQNIELNFSDRQRTNKTTQDVKSSTFPKLEQTLVEKLDECTNDSEYDTVDTMECTVSDTENVSNGTHDIQITNGNDINTIEPLQDVENLDNCNNSSSSSNQVDENVVIDSECCLNGNHGNGLSVCDFCDNIRLGILDWENPDMSLMKTLTKTNVVLAADVVYDTSIIPALVSILKIILSQSSRSVAYIASTIRNEDTRDQFLITLSSEGLKYEQMDSPTLQLFHYDRSVPIEILKITIAT
ncbi:Protein fam86a [Mactra antiquata]